MEHGTREHGAWNLVQLLSSFIHPTVTREPRRKAMNETITWEKRIADPLAVILAALRPDWQMPGIMAALADQKLRDKPPAAVIVAAVRAAANSKVRTPAVIAMDGEHWQEPAAPLPTQIPPRFEPPQPLTEAERAASSKAYAECRRALNEARKETVQ